MNDTTKQELPARPAVLPMPVHDSGEFAELLDTDRFAQIQRVAKLFSESDLVPEVFQGKPANCAVALQMAFRMHVDPMMLMQNMYIVHGRPGIEAKLAIALINQRGPFKGPVQWTVDGEGDARSWTAFAVHGTTGERCAATVTWSMVVAEGWHKAGKGGFPSKWTTLPDLMGRYRSAMFLGRLYCPEVLLGLPTDDELHDISNREIDVTPRGASAPSTAERIGALLAERAERVREVVDTDTGEIAPSAAPAEPEPAPEPANEPSAVPRYTLPQLILKVAEAKSLEALDALELSMDLLPREEDRLVVGKAIARRSQVLRGPE